MSVRQLRQHLSKKSDKELVDEIADLYKKFDVVKGYYQASVFSDDLGVLDKFKKIIASEFIPHSRYAEPPCRLSVAKKAISNYKKVSCSDKNLADIMLYYVECGVDFTITYGDVDDRFYRSMESMFASACGFIVKNGQENLYSTRAKAIVDDAAPCRWGFPDTLIEILYDHFDYEEVD